MKAKPPQLVRDAGILARVTYFRSLPAAELRHLASRCATRTLRPGQILFDEGEPCRGLYIGADGAIEVRQISFRGREQVFHSEGPGATLGEAPLFDRGPYIASAVAILPTRTLFAPRADVLDLCRRHPAVALAVLEGMARRVRRFAGIVSDLTFRPIPERLARYIGEAAAPRPVAAAPNWNLTLTQAQLAARLGTVRELVARTLSQLEESGVIARRRGRIVIRDPRRLAALARGEQSSRTASTQDGQSGLRRPNPRHRSQERAQTGLARDVGAGRIAPLRGSPAPLKQRS